MLARAALWVSAAAIVISLLFGVLQTYGVGLTALPPPADDASQRILDRFLFAEESYWLWGRWNDLAAGMGYGVLLIAVPALSAQAVVRVVLAAGTTLAVAGEAIDLSALAGLEVARVGLDSGLTEVFAAANIFRFAIGTTSTFVGISGLFLLAIGFILLGAEAVEVRARLLSLVVAAALVARGILGPFGGSPGWDVASSAASTVFVVAFVAWVIVTAPKVGRAGTTSSA